MRNVALTLAILLSLDQSMADCWSKLLWPDREHAIDTNDRDCEDTAREWRENGGPARREALIGAPNWSHKGGWNIPDHSQNGDDDAR